MMKKAILLFGLFALVCLSALANGNERMLWGSINSVGNASASAYKSYNNTILLSWRWLPGDNALTAFDLYRSTDGGAEVKLNTNPIKGLTNWQDKTADRSEVYEGTAAVESPHHVRHTVLYEAYKLDGTFMWCICSGPNIMLGNSSSFAIADYDGDGRCEMAIKTGEGTVFGDGQEIGDTDGDGVTDYREKGKHYIGLGPEYFSVGDVDGDGRDEVVYGSMTVDDDGQGLYTSEYGHGDALHLGKFDPSREGLQIWSCQEFGKTMAVLRDARDGSTIWKADAAEDNDTGRGMIAEIDPSKPGCEMWWYQSNAHSISAYAAKPGNGEVVLTLLDGIPQTAGVILRGEPNKTYRLYHAAEGVSYKVSNNYMQRVTTDTQLKQHPDATHWNYILAADHGTAKFFLVAEDTTLAKGKAYLKSNKQLSASAQSSGFQLVIEGDDVTGIGNLTPALSQGEGGVYDLQGRKVSEWGIGHSALKRGLYIVNGKKLYVACCASTDRR